MVPHGKFGGSWICLVMPHNILVAARFFVAGSHDMSAG